METRNEWPLRLGYSLFAPHELINEAVSGYKEIVPGGKVHTSSDCTANLIRMLEDGRLEAVVVTLPIGPSDLFEQQICVEKVLVCLRQDHPLATEASLPKSAISERLEVLFNRDYHPVLYDRLIARFRRAGMRLHPTETYSAPSEMQYLVKTRNCFGLVRERAPLNPDLTTRPIAGFSLKFVTAVVSRQDQQRPAIPVLAYRMAQRCSERATTRAISKKANSR